MKLNLKSKKKTDEIIDVSSISKEAGRLGGQKRIIAQNTPFDIIEAYKATRTNIMFSLNQEKGCKKVVISSATAGEGKTTTCINVAKTFAEVGAKVLVVDADLRAPRVHQYMDCENDKGLSNILAGFNTLDECLVHISNTLDCLTSGAIPPNPVELLSSDTMKELFKELDGRYDYIFIDTPPLNIVTEGLVLTQISNGIIIVTRQKYTMYKMLDRAINSLKFANAKILGFILNDADNDKLMYGVYKRGKKHNRYSRYQYQSYGSGYGYGYGNNDNTTQTDK